MRIINTRNVIQLSAAETKVWEDGGPDGYDFRRRVNSQAADMANKARMPVEIYASKSEGGWCANQVLPD